MHVKPQRTIPLQDKFKLDQFKHSNRSALVGCSTFFARDVVVWCHYLAQTRNVTMLALGLLGCRGGTLYVKVTGEMTQFMMWSFSTCKVSQDAFDLFEYKFNMLALQPD